MAKLNYYYDTETCQYERVKVSKSDILLNLSGFLVVSVFISVIMVFFYNTFFPSQKVASLTKENQELALKYQLLNKQIDETSKMLAALQERDDNVYRVIFEAEPIPDEIRKGGTGGSERYKDLLDEKLSREALVVGTFQKIDRLKRQMYVQTKSYDELIAVAKQKATRLAAMPAIMPLTNKDLKLFASGFGMRIHPIYKVRKMHTGCDFAAAKGTPVYATGDGVVISVGWDGGYGTQIEIDHGFGYITKYAHLSGTNVRLGQKIKRGLKIGQVGSTGASVAPHLHYEVILNGVKRNPVHYFFNDLNPLQYEKLLEVAAQDRQSLG